MTPALLLSMASFALAASVSPGPVNIVALSSGSRFGWRAVLPYVTGATTAFTVLLFLVGLGLNEVVRQAPLANVMLHWAGIAFLLYMAVRLALDSGNLSAERGDAAPTLLDGALMQLLNPKAWLASIAGMGAYAAAGNKGLVITFAAIYFVICYISIGLWGVAGAMMKGLLAQNWRIKLLNRSLAALLVGAAVYLILDVV